MKNKIIIQDFTKFESVLERFETGVIDDNINEGLLSGLMNFLSGVFGGRVGDLDKILGKYKKNESDYWTKWAEANHGYNRAVLKRDTAENEVDRRKYIEMMERTSNLLKQTTKNRHDLNDALERQAAFVIRDNKRLRDYWGMKKAKADEQIAKSSYASLKKEVDEDTVDQLYDNIKSAQAKAKKAIEKMPKGSFTIDFGKYDDMSAKDKKVGFDKFGIHDLDDFIFSQDELWSNRIKLMPRENLVELTTHIKTALEDLRSDLAQEKKNMTTKIAKAEEDEKKRLAADLDRNVTYAQEDISALSTRLDTLNKVTDTKEPLKKEEEKKGPAVTSNKTASHIDAAIGKVTKRVGDVGKKEIDHIMKDITSLYEMMPESDRDDAQEMRERVAQLVDFSEDIYTFRQKNKITGPSTQKDIEQLYTAFKTEFPI